MGRLVINDLRFLILDLIRTIKPCPCYNAEMQKSKI
jgi:hypothetical protein